MRLTHGLLGHAEAAIGALLQCSGPADEALSRYFREHRELGQQERAFVAETAFSVLRRKRSLEAAALLAKDGIHVAVLHSSTVKPLDQSTILAQAARPGRMVVVAENHSTVGGLGEAVATLLLRSNVTPAFQQIGLPDAFLDAGALPTLPDRYGISTQRICRAIKGWL